MPEDIDSISPEELFSQQFKQQLSGSGNDSAASNDDSDPVSLDAAKDPAEAPVVGEPIDPETASTPLEEAPVTTADNPQLTEGESDPQPGAADPVTDTAAEKAQADAGEPQEPWDEELLKQEIPESARVEWRAVHEVKEEVDEIDDGRKDGAAGVNGEMEDTDLEEFTVMTEKEFQAQLKEMMMPTLMKFFRPELLNRFDELIFFTPLRKKELIQIVDIMLRETREMLGEKDLQLKLTDAAREFLAEKGYNPAFGARPLRRAIQEYLEDPLSDLLIQGTFTGGDVIFADAVGGKLEFKKDVGNGKVEDPFAELDNKSETPSEAEANGEKNPVDAEAIDETEDITDPFADKSEADPKTPAATAPEANAQSPFAEAAAPQPGQTGYVFPADANEANQHPMTDDQSPHPEAAQTENEKKRSFLDKMFVKPKAEADPAAANARDSRGEGGIRFENGKIVEE